VLTLLPVLVLAIFMAREARLFFLADLNVLQARWSIGAWADGKLPMTPQSWLRAYNAVQTAIETTPGDAALHVQMGVLYEMTANLPEQRAAQQPLFLRLAAGKYRQALALRPTDGWTWAKMAAVQQTIDPGSAAAWESWRQALRHGPLEDSVRILLLQAGFTGWAQAPAEVKAWIMDLYERSTAKQREEIDDIGLAWGPPDWRGPRLSAMPSVEDERYAAAVEEALSKGLPLPPPPAASGAAPP
jgi:hypothetical protein